MEKKKNSLNISAKSFLAAIVIIFLLMDNKRMPASCGAFFKNTKIPRPNSQNTCGVRIIVL